MSRKNAILATAFFIVAAVLYLIVYGDKFRRPTIQISHTHERSIRRPAANAKVTPHPEFRLDQLYRLTSVKVMELDASGKEPVGSPVWDLTTSSNSNPVSKFRYGANLGGMHPTVTNARALPLTNNLHYRLLVEAGKIKGSHDFTLTDEDYPDNAGE